jgi:hypothetical protein
VVLIAMQAEWAAAQRQTVSTSSTTTVPGAPAGGEYSVGWQDPADPSGKPYSVQTIALHFAPGTRFDTSVPTSCTASDAQLMLIGASACPATSRVGGGSLVTDSNAPFPLPRFGDNEITDFNNTNEVIVLAESMSPPTRLVSRAQISGETVTTEVPALPGNPPPDNFLAFKSLQVTTERIVDGDGAAYLRTPPSCPASGHWSGDFAFTYRDGVTEHVETEAPCQPVGAVQPDGLYGSPARRCTSKRKKHRRRSVATAKKKHKKHCAKKRRKRR